MNANLADELAYRKSIGWPPVTLAEIGRRLDALGYALDRHLDCRSLSLTMTGPRAGKSCPCLSTGIKERNTGRSAFHFQSRRDAAFKELQRLRFKVGLYAVVRGAILDL